MAFCGKEISNPQSGQDIKFILTSKETNGSLLEMESTYRAHSKEPFAHYHPFQSEYFVVLQGELSIRIDNELKILKHGDHIYIPPNTPHTMWNNSNEKTVVTWKVCPALDTEYLLETSCGLAKDHKTKSNGMPGILQIAVMMKSFSRVFRLAKPPYVLQKILFALITPLAVRLGYRATYAKYLD